MSWRYVPRSWISVGFGAVGALTGHGQRGTACSTGLAPQGWLERGQGTGRVAPPGHFGGTAWSAGAGAGRPVSLGRGIGADARTGEGGVPEQCASGFENEPLFRRVARDVPGDFSWRRHEGRMGGFPGQASLASWAGSWLRGMAGCGELFGDLLVSQGIAFVVESFDGI